MTTTPPLHTALTARPPVSGQRKAPLRCRLRLHRWTVTSSQDGAYGRLVANRCHLCPAERMNVYLWRDS